MTCLNLSNGTFVPVPWSTAPTTNSGQATVTRTATSISVQHALASGSVNINGDFLYAVFGDRSHVALLSRQAGALITWRVTMVDISGASLSATLLFDVNLPSTNSPPQVAASPGNGRLAFFWSGTGNQSEIGTMMIVRSDDGSVVLAGPGTISGAIGGPTAQITATELIIDHPNSGSLDMSSAPRPRGELSVSPSQHDFGEAVLGGSDPTAGSVTRSFTLTNSGTDCLTVSAIANDAPFTVSAASLAALPVELDPGDSRNVDVVFTPGAPGNNISGSLPITRSPAAGDAFLNCTGDARAAEAEISVSRSSINFGTIPHPGTATQSFTISNTGEKDVLVTVSGPTGPDFTWTGIGTFNLPVTGSGLGVDVTFTTPGDTAATPDTVTVTPSEGNARTVALSGAGCIANAVPVLPPAGPLNFGQVEQGFRTVRFIEVRNTGDGDLIFQARIAPGADPSHAALFGLVLPGNDVTDAPASRTYTVLPTSRCGTGPTGDGILPVAVGFHADAIPNAAYSAVLEVDDPVAGTTTAYPLSAEITPAIPVDAVVAFDRSGSMNDPVGGRLKIDAARQSGILFAQLLRDSADDRAAIVTFNETPTPDFPIDSVAGNMSAIEGAFGGIIADGSTNIAGGMIVGEEQFSNPPHPTNPPDLKRALIVLTDGRENRCFQRGGSGDWFSVTGRDAADGMLRPDLTPQDTEVLGIDPNVRVYGIGLGNAADIDVAALDAVSTATGGHFGLVDDLTGADFFLLEKYFTQIFMEAAGLAQVMDPFYRIPPGEKHAHQFDIFPGDVNTMIVLYDDPAGRLPFTILTPKGETFAPGFIPPGFSLRFRSTPTARFAEINFPRGEPDRYAGRWTVTVVHEGRTCVGNINGDPEREGGGRGDEVQSGFLPRKCRDTKEPVRYGIAIGAGSNLRLQPFVEPGTKFVGDPLRLNAVVSEAGLPVTGATVTGTVERPSGSVDQVTLRDDGGNEDGDADDGEYGRRYLQASEGGTYRLTFRATGVRAGRPFMREAYRTKFLHDPRRPPRPGSGPSGGGGFDDCCERLLKYLMRRDEGERPMGKPG